jgi:FimV-like protein
MKHTTRAIATGLLLAVSLCLSTVQAASYGPVKSNETLWDIAARYRPSYDISVPQMMAAFRAKNPHAFTGGDINVLKRGVYLQIPVVSETRQASSQDVTSSLRSEINTLRTQLQQEQANSAQLAEQLKQLQAPGTAAPTPATTSETPDRSAQLQTELAVKLQTELAELKQQLQAKDARITELEAAVEAAKTQAAATPVPATAPSDQQATDKMQAELAELKQLLEQRDNHIQNLQASLREASISIKRQFAESQALHEQLKTLKPDATAAAPQPPAEPGSSIPPSLTLAGTEAGKPADAAAPAAETAKPVFADQLAPPAPVPADSKPAVDRKPVSLQNMLQQQTGNGAVGSDGSLPTPSKVSLAVALISLIFVLALVWRSFSQQRSLREEEARLRAALGSDAG